MDYNYSSKKKLGFKPVIFAIPMVPFLFNLSDACLGIVFDSLPLKDLLHCNLVCRQWNRVHQDACSRRRKFTLIIGCPGHNSGKPLYYSAYDTTFNSHPFANWDDELSPMRHSWLLRMHRNLDHSLVYGLMRNLPNITTLEIILTYVSIEALDHVVQLLRFWAKSLVSLKLWLTDKSLAENEVKSKNLNLIYAINSLSRLTHFTLKYRDMAIHGKDANNEPVLRIQLEGLKEFYFANYYYEADACKAIFRYAQMRPNLRIGFDKWFTKEEQTELLSYNPQVVSRIGQIAFEEIVTEPLLSSLCGRLSNLTSLHLTICKIPIRKWTRALAQCSQLAHLKLNSVLGSQSPDLLHPSTRNQITQLNSVKSLSLALLAYNHFAMQTLQIVWIFPNLENFKINDYNRDRCVICKTVRDVFSETVHTNCLNLLLYPLKELKHLPSVKYLSLKTRKMMFYK